MEQLLEKLGWKKLAIIIVGVSLVFLIFVMSSIFYTNQGPASKNESAKNKEKNAGNSKGSFSVPSSGNFTNQYYSIDYPSYFIVEKGNKKEGTLSYTSFKDKSSNAKIDVTVIDSKVQPIEIAEKPFINSSYEPESYPVGNMNVDEFFKIDEGGERVVQKVIFVQKNGKIIQADFTYSGESPDYELERDFVKMISSIE